MNWVVSSTVYLKSESKVTVLKTATRAGGRRSSRTGLISRVLESPFWKRGQPKPSPEDAVVWESVPFQPLSFAASVAATKTRRKPRSRSQFLRSKPPAALGWLLLPFLLCWRPDTRFAGCERSFSKSTGSEEIIAPGSPELQSWGEAD